MTPTMKLPLGPGFQYSIAQRCAEIIHNELIARHLYRIGYKRASMGSDIAEVRALFRALPPGRCTDRDEMRITVKYLFNLIMTERHTERRWHDYVRRVAALDGASVPAAEDISAWTTFRLTSREAAAA